MILEYYPKYIVKFTIKIYLSEMYASKNMHVKNLMQAFVLQSGHFRIIDCINKKGSGYSA